MNPQTPTNLYQYYTGQGQALPSLQDRGQLFEQYGLGDASGYTGTAKQNTQLLNTLMAQKGGNQQKPTQPAPAVVTSKQGADLVNEMNNTFDSVENRMTRTRQESEALDKELGEYTDEYVKTINQIQNGTIPLNETDKAILNGIKNVYDQLRSEQTVLNTRFTSGTTITGIRAGRQRYAPEIEAANIQNSIEQGLDKLKAIDNEAALKIAQARQDIFDRKFKLAKEKYDAYKGLIGDKRDTIDSLNKLTFDYERLKNDAKTSDIKEYEYAVGQGYNGTFQQFMNAQRARSATKTGGKKITARDILNMGLPESFVGMNEGEIYSSLTSPNPPDWFRNYLQEELQQSVTDSFLQTAWDSYKNSSEIAGFVDNLTASVSIGDSAFTGGGSSGGASLNPYQ